MVRHEGCHRRKAFRLINPFRINGLYWGRLAAQFGAMMYSMWLRGFYVELGNHQEALFKIVQHQPTTMDRSILAAGRCPEMPRFDAPIRGKRRPERD